MHFLQCFVQLCFLKVIYNLGRKRNLYSYVIIHNQRMSSKSPCGGWRPRFGWPEWRSRGVKLAWQNLMECVSVYHLGSVGVACKWVWSCTGEQELAVTGRGQYSVGRSLSEDGLRYYHEVRIHHQQYCLKILLHICIMCFKAALYVVLDWKGYLLVALVAQLCVWFFALITSWLVYTWNYSS